MCQCEPMLFLFDFTEIPGCSDLCFCTTRGNLLSLFFLTISPPFSLSWPLELPKCIHLSFPSYSICSFKCTPFLYFDSVTSNALFLRLILFLLAAQLCTICQIAYSTLYHSYCFVCSGPGISGSFIIFCSFYNFYFSWLICSFYMILRKILGLCSSLQPFQHIKAVVGLVKGT